MSQAWRELAICPRALQAGPPRGHPAWHRPMEEPCFVLVLTRAQGGPYRSSVLTVSVDPTWAGSVRWHSCASVSPAAHSSGEALRIPRTRDCLPAASARWSGNRRGPVPLSPVFDAGPCSEGSPEGPWHQDQASLGGTPVTQAFSPVTRRA